MPETYSPEERESIRTRVLEGLAKGTPLAALCREEGMPHRSVIYDWRDEDESFARRIARAREIGFDAIAEEALEIADDGSNDYVEKERADGTRFDAFDAEHVQRSKLRIETRLKLLAKWDPKRYGDKVDLGLNVGMDPETAEWLGLAPRS